MPKWRRTGFQRSVPGPASDSSSSRRVACHRPSSTRASLPARLEEASTGYSVCAKEGPATRQCARCGTEIEERFRFCPWCAAPQRLKLTEFFVAHRRDRGRALRVSRYLGEEPHVRFSVWNEEGMAEAAVSLDPAEARRLARFLGGGLPAPTPAAERLRRL